MLDIFDPTANDALIGRIRLLTSDSERRWGKMTVDQMLAHCCKPFDTIFDPDYARNHPKPNVVFRTLLRLLVKPILVGEKPYKHGMRTAPESSSKGVETLPASKRG